MSSRESLRAALDAANRQIENVTKLRVRDLISDEEFTKERDALQNEKLRLTQRLETDESADAWFEPARLLVLFSNRAVLWFSEGTSEVKRLILTVTGLNPTLVDRQLNIDARKPFERCSKTTKIPTMSSILEDVRTRWYARDPELMETVAVLRRLVSLAQPAKISDAA